jgi:hypothetical protein
MGADRWSATAMPLCIDVWSTTIAPSVPLRHRLMARSRNQAGSTARGRTTSAAGVRYAQFRWRDHR